LRATSPCIDKGTIVAGVTGAFHGDAPDLGCYEIHAIVVTMRYRRDLAQVTGRCTFNTSTTRTKDCELSEGRLKRNGFDVHFWTGGIAAAPFGRFHAWRDD